MTYQEAVAYVTSLEGSLGSDYSLREVAELCRRMGNPEQKLRCIHIAGTNGKGSVGNYISNILAVSGCRVGRYVSPAVFGYREKIQQIAMAGQPGERSGGQEIGISWISEKETAETLTVLKRECEKMVQEGYQHPTAFEIETVMAFCMFLRWGVDVAVVEAGLGGRLDATNVIPHPLLCVFTSISRDHMAFLGNTISEIAREKYGIIKENTNVVSASQPECIELLKKYCRKKHAALYLAGENEGEDGGGCLEGELSCATQDGLSVTFSYCGRQYTLRQAGIYQVSNAVLAVEAAHCLKKSGFSGITEDTVQKGLCQSRWKGRFDIVSQDPFILADGAHNPDAARKLRDSLSQFFPGECFCFIAGVFRDKEYQEMIRVLLPLAESFYTVTAPGKRGLLSSRLKEAACEALREKAVGKEGACEALGEKAVGKEEACEALGEKAVGKEMTCEALREKAVGNGAEDAAADRMAAEPAERTEVSVSDCGTVREALRQASGRRRKIVVFGSLSILKEVYEAAAPGYLD